MSGEGAEEASGAVRVRQADFQAADGSTAFRIVCTDEAPSRWLLRQDGVLVASGVADTPEDARDEAVVAAKDVLGQDFIAVVEWANHISP